MSCRNGSDLVRGGGGVRIRGGRRGKARLLPQHVHAFERHINTSDLTHCDRIDQLGVRDGAGAQARIEALLARVGVGLGLGLGSGLGSGVGSGVGSGLGSGLGLGVRLGRGLAIEALLHAGGEGAHIVQRRI